MFLFMIPRVKLEYSQIYRGGEKIRAILARGANA
jgi:hypothetical protein